MTGPEVFVAKLTKHDKYVQELVSRLQPRYDYLITNKTICNKKRKLAEIDILAIKGKQKDVFEVKCSYRITKARLQFRKLRKHLNFDNAYFFCGASQQLKKIAV
ncbi:hypothetical protein GOV04_04650 [Candidatus Woesearchaeota archaeon]|nr:hypothetical protein [Candidatus Woesearchaeota archaeon]